VARAGSPSVPAVSTLLQHETSAYQARLFADEEAVVLVTQTGFTSFRRGEAAETHSIPLGPIAVRQGASVIFWRSGWLREASLSGASERQLAAVPRAPQYLLASGSRLAWIDVDPKTGASLKTLSGGDVRVVDESVDRVCASVLRDSVVYWILQSRGGAWRIGSISLDGQHRKLTGAYPGRPPAMLALGPDGVYFYDGPERAVCAQVGGLFEVPPEASAPRFLASEHAGPITALAATNERLFWVAENGEDRLVVRSLALPAL
jgi:hypothetical protein